MIGRFPWDPFPPGEPEPPGDDPLLAAIYRGGVEGADAYRAVRSALRRDGGVLRVGNRFVPDGRYREVAFVALGHAASSMALAVLHVFGDRVTQGFVAGPEEPPASVPFRSVTVADGWGGDAAAPGVIEAAREIAGGLGPSDLLLLLVSPGALRTILVPPPDVDAAAFADLLRGFRERGARGPEVVEAARVLGAGGVGGRLLPAAVAADVQCLLVDRGDGPRAVGGGPTYPVTDDERQRVRATLARIGPMPGLPAAQLPPADQPLPTGAGLARRPVVVAGPTDGLRSAADVAFDKGWTARTAVLGLNERPAPAAERFLASVEELIGRERPGEGTKSKGMVVFATTTLDVPEGVPEREAVEEFLGRVRAGLRRREMSVGLLRTAGPLGPGPDLGGAVVGARGDPAAKGSSASLRPLRMPRGITDVGMLAVALAPAPGAR